jgi:aspartate/methionine/tyrosine aminotransferase
LNELASRLQNIEPFRVMELLARARMLEASGRSIVHMEIGEPDFESPQPVIDAGIAALRQGQTHYTPATGLPALREAISRYYRDHYGVDVPAARIVITPGSSGALLLAMASLVNPGDKVMMPDPGYPCNRNFVRLFDAEPVSLELDADDGFRLDLERLQQAWRPGIRLLLLASPSNPTGSVLKQDELRAIVEFVEGEGAVVLMDEIYHGLVYGEPAPTVLSCSDNAIVINSFSKYFGMTGWRVGWMVAPESLVPALDKLAQNIFLAASTPAQHAACAVFDPEAQAILAQRRDVFRQRRDYLVPALRKLGFGIAVEPQGAFYIYADCSRFTNDSFAFCENLLEQSGVAITPGRDFGDHHPERYVRFAYTTSMQQLELGIARLGEAIK